ANLAIPAVLAPRRARPAERPHHAPVAGLARQEPRDRRLPAAAGPPRARAKPQGRPRRLARVAIAGETRLEPQHVLHAVESRRLADEPLRRPDRALRVDRAVGRAVHQFEPLAGAGEDDVVVADRVAAA